MLNWKDRKYVNPRKKVFKNLDTNEILNLEIQDDPDNILEESETPLTAHNLNLAQAELVDDIGTQTQSEREVLTLEEAIQENTEYEIPVTYEVGNNSLEIYYQGTKLIKDVEYLEVGTEGTFSNKIKFHNWGQNVPVGRTIEFIVRGTILTKAITSEETKAQIEIIKAEQEEQNTNIEANANEIEAIKQENALLRSQIPQGQAEGEYITLKDSSNLPFDEFNIKGNSEQATRDDKNKFDLAKIVDASYVYEVTQTGVKLKNTWVTGIYTNENVLKTFKPNTTYTMRAKAKVISRPSTIISPQLNLFALYRAPTDNSPVFWRDCLKMTDKDTVPLNEEKYYISTFTIPADLTDVRLVSYTFYGNNDGGTTGQGMGEIEISEIMLVEGSYTEDNFPPYEPYGIMPSPEFSSDIRNCGDDVNLFNKDTVVHGFISDTTGNFLASSTRYASDYMEVEQNENYYVTPQDNTNWGAWYDENKNFISGISSYGVVTAPVNAKYMRITIKNDDYLNIMKIQKGTVATPWSPFGCGTINIEKCNKNLCPKLVKGVGIDSTNGKEVSSSARAVTDYIVVDFNKNPSYFLSGLLGTRLWSWVGAYNIKKEFLGRTGASPYSNLLLNKNLFTAGTAQGVGDIAYIRLTQYEVSGQSTGTLDDLDNAQIQLEPGETATSYVEHQSKTITFPLAKGQVLHEDDYLAEDGIHQKRSQSVIKIDRIITLTNGNQSGTCNVIDKIYKSDNMLLCSNAIFTKNRTNPNSGTVYENQGNIVFVGTPEDTLETLRAKYNGGIVEYELAQEQVIPYTSEQKKVYNELLNSATYKNVTNICSLDEIKPTFEVKYRKDLETLLGGVANE